MHSTVATVLRPCGYATLKWLHGEAKGLRPADPFFISGEF
jgi:hypothetical protein